LPTAWLSNEVNGLPASLGLLLLGVATTHLSNNDKVGGRAQAEQLCR
jgi:hypothetical protein